MTTTKATAKTLAVSPTLRIVFNVKDYAQAYGHEVDEVWNDAHTHLAEIAMEAVREAAMRLGYVEEVRLEGCRTSVEEYEQPRKFTKVADGVWRCGPIEVRDIKKAPRTGYDDLGRANMWVGSSPWVRNVSTSTKDLKDWVLANYDKIIAEYGEDGQK